MQTEIDPKVNAEVKTTREKTNDNKQGKQNSRYKQYTFEYIHICVYAHTHTCVYIHTHTSATVYSLMANGTTEQSAHLKPFYRENDTDTTRINEGIYFYTRV